MLTQVTFKTDDALKKAALAKAKSEGITLKALLSKTLQDYIDGRVHVDIVYEDVEIEKMELNDEIQAKVDAVGALLSKVAKKC